MMKDKKPFTYTPGGLDLSEIRSPRMMKRLARNASLEGPKDSPLARPHDNHSNATGPSSSSATTGLPVQVFPMPGMAKPAASHTPAAPKKKKEEPKIEPKVMKTVCGPSPPPPPFDPSFFSENKSVNNFNKSAACADPTNSSSNNNSSSVTTPTSPPISSPTIDPKSSSLSYASTASSLNGYPVGNNIPPPPPMPAAFKQMNGRGSSGPQDGRSPLQQAAAAYNARFRKSDEDGMHDSTTSLDSDQALSESSSMIMDDYSLSNLDDSCSNTTRSNVGEDMYGSFDGHDESQLSQSNNFMNDQHIHERIEMLRRENEMQQNMEAAERERNRGRLEDEERQRIEEERRVQLYRLKMEEEQKLFKQKEEEARLNEQYKREQIRQEEEERLVALKKEKERHVLIKQEEEERLEMLRREEEMIQQLKKEEEERRIKLKIEEEKMVKLRQEEKLLQLRREEENMAQRRQEEERIAQMKQEEERMIQIRQEEERMIQIKQEEERMIQIRQEEERIAQLRQEEERIAQIRQEEERLAKLRDLEERMAQIKQEEERISREREEEERMSQIREEEERVSQAREEEERLAKLRHEEERMAQIKMEEERLMQIRQEEERITQIRLEEERVSQAREEQERLAKLRHQEERMAQMKMEEERLAQIRQEEERIKEEERIRQEEERVSQARQEQERLAKLRHQEERMAQKKMEEEKLAQIKKDEEERKQFVQQEQLRVERLKREEEERQNKMQQEERRLMWENAEKERKEKLAYEEAERSRLLKEHEMMKEKRVELEEQERIRKMNSQTLNNRVNPVYRQMSTPNHITSENPMGKPRLNRSNSINRSLDTAGSSSGLAKAPLPWMSGLQRHRESSLPPEFVNRAQNSQQRIHQQRAMRQQSMNDNQDNVINHKIQLVDNTGKSSHNSSPLSPVMKEATAVTPPIVVDQNRSRPNFSSTLPRKTKFNTPTQKPVNTQVPVQQPPRWPTVQPPNFSQQNQVGKKLQPNASMNESGRVRIIPISLEPDSPCENKSAPNFNPNPTNNSNYSSFSTPTSPTQNEKVFYRQEPQKPQKPYQNPPTRAPVGPASRSSAGLPVYNTPAGLYSNESAVEALQQMQQNLESLNMGLQIQGPVSTMEQPPVQSRSFRILQNVVSNELNNDPKKEEQPQEKREDPHTEVQTNPAEDPEDAVEYQCVQAKTFTGPTRRRQSLPPPCHMRPVSTQDRRGSSGFGGPGVPRHPGHHNAARSGESDM